MWDWISDAFGAVSDWGGDAVDTVGGWFGGGSDWGDVDSALANAPWDATTSGALSWAPWNDAADVAYVDDIFSNQDWAGSFGQNSGFLGGLFGGGQGGQQDGGWGEIFSTGMGALGQGYQANQMRGLASDYANQADPFAKYRPYYAQGLQNLYTNPQSFQADPGYQWRLDQGLQALYRTANTYGLGASGNTMAEATKYAQDMASNEFGNVWERLATLSGANQPPVQGANAMFAGGQAAHQADSSFLGSLGGLGSSIGDKLGF